MTPGTSIGFPSILGGGGGGSTWAAVGNENAWGEIWIPEPTAFAMAGVGVVALAVSRRRTQTRLRVGYDFRRTTGKIRQLTASIGPLD